MLDAGFHKRHSTGPVVVIAAEIHAFRPDGLFVLADLEGVLREAGEAHAHIVVNTVLFDGRAFQDADDVVLVFLGEGTRLFELRKGRALF